MIKRERKQNEKKRKWNEITEKIRRKLEQKKELRVKRGE